jgi:hypothetical protein
LQYKRRLIRITNVVSKYMISEMLKDQDPDSSHFAAHALTAASDLSI